MSASPSQLGPDTWARMKAVTDEPRRACEGWYGCVLAPGEANPAVSAAPAAHYLDTQLTTVLLQMGLGQDPGLVRAQAKPRAAQVQGTKRSTMEEVATATQEADKIVVF